MMTKPLFVFGLLAIFLVAKAEVTDELLAVVKEEQAAFKEGDCDKAVSLLDRNITFYANGRKMSREQVGNFCRGIKRPFGDGRDPIEDTITPHEISENLGYTIRDFRWADRDGQVIHEVVTKIWEKKESGWKIIHFQSTVQPE
jgi:hypothetical protein